MSLTHPNTPVSQQDLQDFYHKIVPYMGNSGVGEVTSQVLTGGSTSVVFTNIPTEGNYLVDFFTSTGVNYTAINTATAGQVALTFEAQATDITVYCEVKGVTV